MKAIQNVIEMLSSIIKDGQSISDLEAMLASKDEEKPNLQTTSYQESNHKQHKKETTVESKYSERYNYVHYDTGLHWCRLCDDFPETAKDYLLHLQDKDHRQMAKENDVDNTPWHKVPPEPVLPSDEDAPTKRIPIKGITENRICQYMIYDFESNHIFFTFLDETVFKSPLLHMCNLMWI